MDKIIAKPGYVELMITKNAGGDGYRGMIEADNTDVLVEALAVMMQRAAMELGAPIHLLYAKVATLLFAQEDAAEETGRAGSSAKKHRRRRKNKGGNRNGKANKAGDGNH